MTPEVLLTFLKLTYKMMCKQCDYDGDHEFKNISHLLSERVTLLHNPDISHVKKYAVL